MQPEPAQGTFQDVGKGTEVQPQLVGIEGLGAGAVGKQVELLLLDAVLCLSPRAQ
jgi:hypothetical protein